MSHIIDTAKAIELGYLNADGTVPGSSGAYADSVSVSTDGQVHYTYDDGDEGDCEHGLSAINCYGPQHYYYDAEEQGRGWYNS